MTEIAATRYDAIMIQSENAAFLRGSILAQVACGREMQYPTPRMDEHEPWVIATVVTILVTGAVLIRLL
jgi:hypothetical protein